MLALWKDPDRPRSVGELGERPHLDSGTLTPLLKRLVSMGYVTRSRDAADERRVLVALTADGLALRDQLAAVPRSIASCLGLDPAEGIALRERLTALTASLEASALGWYRVAKRCAPITRIFLRRTVVPDPSGLFPSGPRVAHDLLIRPMLAQDAAQVLAIYQAGLDTGQASFETVAPAWEAFDAARLPSHRHVAAYAATREVLGWVAVSAVSSRPVYAGVVEHSVYVHPGQRGRGVGAALLGALIRSSEAAGVWTIQSAVFPENTASLALHKRAGFRVVGVRERVGCHHGRWRDTVLIERRSGVAGTG